MRENDKVEIGIAISDISMTVDSRTFKAIKPYLEKIEKIIAEQADEDEWIPVSEGLPPTHEAVIVYVQKNTGWRTYQLAMWNEQRGGWEDWLRVDMLEQDLGYKVLAWSDALPEPYEGE